MSHTEIRVRTELVYEVRQPTSFAMAIIAARTPRQHVTAEVLEVAPELVTSLVAYGSGSHQLLRFEAPRGELRVNYAASITLEGRDVDPSTLAEVPFGRIPADVMPYLNPSRYCESDKLDRFALRLFGDLPGGHQRVREVSDWVEANLVYEPGVTDGSSGTADVLLQRAGVCRDFAHVSISLCRALGIPARYVSGYGIGVVPQDFHGFFEAYLDDDWYAFDPSGMAPINSLARIGFGRDAADVPFATFVGDAIMQTMTVDVVEADQPEPGATSTN